MVRTTRDRCFPRGAAAAAILAFFLGGSGAGAAPRFFGHYVGEAAVSTSPYYPPGTYPAEALIAETASGIVGYLNIAYDPGDVLGGTITHSFSAPLAGDSPLLALQYSDRLCGGGDPIGKCYPQGGVQYSFEGQALFLGTHLELSAPSLLPGLPYEAALPFDAAQLVRIPSKPRTSFEGLSQPLEYVWMGTIFLPLPLPLYGTNRVLVEDGEIVEWIGNGGIPIPVPGVVSASCFDDVRGLGWMNQQGEWRYDWVLDPGGRGLGVIVTFASPPPDCEDLLDPLAGENLDDAHWNLVGVMYEPAPLVSGPGAISALRLGRGAGGMLDLVWEGDCGTGIAYALYRGDLAAGPGSAVPEPGHCSETSHVATIPAGTGAADFFLVVPNDGAAEGSYGIDSQGNRRPPSAEACYPPSPVNSCAP
jgi:hypothetical protein